MSIRHLVVAALLASAGAAQADVVSTATFVNGWTAANGTNVISSGVLGGDVSLVGGIAHSSNSANLTNSLAGNASAYMSASDAQKLFVQQGIDATYLLSAGNGLLAARYGNSTSVINDGDGVKIVVGATPGAGAAIPGGAGGAVGGGGAIGGGDAVGGGAVGGGGVIGGGDAIGGNTGNNGGTNAGGGNATQPGAGTGVGAIMLPAADPVLQDEVAAVPEPGTVALMLAGLIGAGSLSRRRSKR